MNKGINIDIISFSDKGVHARPGTGSKDSQETDKVSP